MTNLTERNQNQSVVEAAPQKQGALAADFLVAKIWLMQPPSEFVAERKAMVGDIVKSTTAEKIGDTKKPIQILPLRCEQFWSWGETIGNQFEYRGRYARTAANAMDPWDYEENGVKCRRTKELDIYCLLVDDIAAAVANEKSEDFELSKVLTPVVITFKSTSFKAGMAISSQFTKAEQATAASGRFIAPYSQKIELACYDEKNDKGPYVVWKVTPLAGPAGRLSDDEKKQAGIWYDIVNTTKLQVHEATEGADFGDGGKAKYTAADAAKETEY